MKKGKIDALLGIVFGDEGKGKVVDVFTPKYDVVARFAGGPNAGHTIIFEGKKFVIRTGRALRAWAPSRRLQKPRRARRRHSREARPLRSEVRKEDPR